jgi:hypothetical protein
MSTPDHSSRQNLLRDSIPLTFVSYIRKLELRSAIRAIATKLGISRYCDFIDYMLDLVSGEDTEILYAERYFLELSLYLPLAGLR